MTSDPYVVRCRRCATESKFGGLLDDEVRVLSHPGSSLDLSRVWLSCLLSAFCRTFQAQIIQPTGPTCPSCSAGFPLPSLAVQLELQLRAHIGRYYEAVLKCDDSSCATSTRAMGVYGRRCMVRECKGRVHLEVRRQQRCTTSLLS